MIEPSSNPPPPPTETRRVSQPRSRPGSPWPLGATLTAEGVNFAIFSEHATGVEVCLFDQLEAPQESARIVLHEHTDGVWNPAASDQTLPEFTARLVAFRREHPVFRRPKFFTGRKVRGHEFRDLQWVNPGGTPMHADEWTNGFTRCLGAILNGDASDVHDAGGKPILDDTFMVLFNAHHEPMTFTLAGSADLVWQLILDTREEAGFLAEPRAAAAGSTLEVLDRSICLLRLEKRAKTPRTRRRTA